MPQNLVTLSPFSVSCLVVGLVGLLKVCKLVKTMCMCVLDSVLRQNVFRQLFCACVRATKDTINGNMDLRESDTFVTN